MKFIVIVNQINLAFERQLKPKRKKKEKIELKSIQYHALRIPYNKPLMFSHSELLQLANVKTIDERSKETNEKYFIKTVYFQ